MFYVTYIFNHSLLYDIQFVIFNFNFNLNFFKHSNIIT
ncbi:hypothetical protein PFUGPA_03236 [Plasmodium falciparum Palo Alto/Uganda]|uniref:Uncharacterized protein n=1 Tax=Plasmodium falciparum (isolate Palo Alto / Uganda) TaxID=57270 RepID=W4IXV4_PLAFP|nr:hypothetical protein PFUGPA_03236 [Plasmodium falciparum Palo Alto/Uganda]